MCRAPDRSRARSSDAAFALLEVLAAVAILGFVLSTIGMVMAITLAGVRSAADRVALTETARTLLDTLPRGGALQVGTTTGLAGTTRWTIVVAPTGNSGPPPPRADDEDTFPRWRPASVTITARTARGRVTRLDTVGLIRRPTP